MAATAASKASALARDGARKPLTLRTNWRAAARISSSVAGSSARRRVLIDLHMGKTLDQLASSTSRLVGDHTVVLVPAAP